MVELHEATRRVSWLYKQAQSIFYGSRDFEISQLQVQTIRGYLGIGTHVRATFDILYTGDRVVSIPFHTIVFSAKDESFDICTMGDRQKPSRALRENRRKRQQDVIQKLANLRDAYTIKRYEP